MRCVVVHKILLFVHYDPVEQMGQVGSSILKGIKMTLCLVLGLERRYYCLDKERYFFMRYKVLRHFLQLQRIMHLNFIITEI